MHEFLVKSFNVMLAVVGVAMYALVGPHLMA